MDELPVRADVSPALHPGALAPHASSLGEDGPALAQGRAALAVLYKFCGSLADAERGLAALAPDARLTTRPDGSSAHLGPLRVAHGGHLRVFSGHEEEYVAAASAAYERVAAEVGKRLKLLQSMRVTEAEQVCKETEDDTGTSLQRTALAQEIRAYVKALPPAERLPFLARAANDIDGQRARQVLSAVVHAPHFLSGLSREQEAAALGLLEQRCSPHHAASRDALDRMIGQVENGLVLARQRKEKAERLATGTPQAKAKKIIAGVGA